MSQSIPKWKFPTSGS